MMEKHKKAQSLQQQLLIRFFLLFLALLTILGIYQYANMKKYLYGSKIEFLDSRFKNIDKKIIVSSTNEFLLKNNTQYFLNETAGEEVCVVIIDNEGNVIASENTYNGIPTDTSKNNNNVMAVPILSEEEYLEILETEGLASGYNIIEDSDGREQIVIYRQIGSLLSPSGLIQISTYIDSSNKILLEQGKMYAISAVFILLLGTFLGSKVVKYILRPLNKMTKTLDEINIGKLDVRLDDENGQIEVDKLAVNFNKMIERLKISFDKEKSTNERMKNFVLDASHELRTPLTSIQGFIEILQMGAAKNKEQVDIALNSMLIESQRLSKLVNKLLLLTKLEGNYSFEKKSENINNIIREVYPNLSMLSKNKSISLTLGDDTYSIVNKDQVKQVVYNLVQNAINYTNEDGKIIISTKCIIKDNVKYIEMSVKDNGEGISEKNLNLLFDRFYRADKHRSRKKGGYGLGLSIVKSIVDNHNGMLDVKTELGKGSEFLVYFIAQ